MKDLEKMLAGVGLGLVIAAALVEWLGFGLIELCMVSASCSLWTIFITREKS